MRKFVLVSVLILLALIACSPQPPAPSEGDIQTAIAKTKTAELPPVPNEIDTPQPPPATPMTSASGITVDLECTRFNAPGDDSKNKEEEYVCFGNQADRAVDLTGWILTDEYGWDYTFPDFSLESGAFVRVRTGCGEDSEQDLYWCFKGESAVWNNDEDCVFLKDSQGEDVLQYCY
jgi:hypothetical protein